VRYSKIDLMMSTQKGNSMLLALAHHWDFAAIDAFDSLPANTPDPAWDGRSYRAVFTNGRGKLPLSAGTAHRQTHIVSEGAARPVVSCAFHQTLALIMPVPTSQVAGDRSLTNPTNSGCVESHVS
jgi:hypothetical protein